MMLHSFSSMHTMAHKSTKELATFQQEKDQLPQLRIFVVSTFKEQLVKEGRHERVVYNLQAAEGVEGKAILLYNNPRL